MIEKTRQEFYRDMLRALMLKLDRVHQGMAEAVELLNIDSASTDEMDWEIFGLFLALGSVEGAVREQLEELRLLHSQWRNV